LVMCLLVSDVIQFTTLVTTVQRNIMMLPASEMLVPIYSEKLFTLQKIAVRIITGHGNRTSCRDLFKQLEILPLKSQYIYLS
jgi:hypothetical protein